MNSPASSLLQGILVGLVLLVILWVIKHASTIRLSKRTFKGPTETDMRLTYKRFKELYPYSKITYQEYKKLQKEKAFKRTVSSQKIKRMVR